MPTPSRHHLLRTVAWPPLPCILDNRVSWAAHLNGASSVAVVALGPEQLRADAERGGNRAFHARVRAYQRRAGRLPRDALFTGDGG